MKEILSKWFDNKRESKETLRKKAHVAFLNTLSSTEQRK